MDPIESYVIDVLRDYEPERVILFGSRARGSFHPESDVDLLIVKEDPRRPIERIRDVQARLYHRDRRHVWRNLPPFETLVLTRAELDERLQQGDPFFSSAVRDGRTIFERGKDAA